MSQSLKEAIATGSISIAIGSSDGGHPIHRIIPFFKMNTPATGSAIQSIELLVLR
jgi:hypothetical protein